MSERTYTVAIDEAPSDADFAALDATAVEVAGVVAFEDAGGRQLGSV